MLRLTFHGAAETVTGSKYLLQADDTQVLIDCGLFQGIKSNRQMNWAAPLYRPNELAGIVITHAHLDHIGWLPRLLRYGYTKPIHCTPATADLLELQLLDSAKIQEEDAEYANRKGFSKHRPALPLYTSHDVHRILKLVVKQPFGKWFSPGEPVWCRFHDTGHLLGAAMVETEVRQTPTPTRLLFSGDVGRYNAPLYHDPSPPPPCDYLVCEATYGDREHPSQDVQKEIVDLVTAAVQRGGMLVIAAFAVGRTQQLLYLMQALAAQGKIPDLPIYIDSPMAVEATEIFENYSAAHDLSEGLPAAPSKVFSGKRIHLARTGYESKKINSVYGPAVIIATSGMMTGGRILHHLRVRLPHPENTVVIGGYTAEGTRGRTLADGSKTLRIHGQDIPVRAAIAHLSGMSGHADRSELLRWLQPLESVRRVFLTHGEPSGLQGLSVALTTTRGWDVTIPKLGEQFEL